MSEERSSPQPRTVISPRRRESSRGLLGALFFAILLHLPILIALPWLVEMGARKIDPGAELGGDFTLTVVDEDSALEQAQKPEKEREERKKEREKLEKERQGQFISEAPPEVEETPDEARFLDQYASKAERDTVKPEPRTPEKEPGASAAPSPDFAPEKIDFGQPEKPEQEPPTEEQPEEESPSPKLTEEAPDSPEQEPSEQETGDLELDEDSLAERELLKSGSRQRAQRESQNSPGDPSVDPRELFPNFANTAPPGGGSESFDYLSDVDEGEKTLLNRKRSRYWSFMQRLKESVAKEWRPVEEYRRRDPHGNVYGVKNRYTVLSMTLNGDGSLRTIYVMRASGLDFYDKEAVRAIRAAAPFPNPPEGLKDEDGLIQINFGLLLDISTGSVRQFRIRRQ